VVDNNVRQRPVWDAPSNALTKNFHNKQKQQQTNKQKTKMFTKAALSLLLLTESVKADGPLCFSHFCGSFGVTIHTGGQPESRHCEDRCVSFFDSQSYEGFSCGGCSTGASTTLPAPTSQIASDSPSGSPAPVSNFNLALDLVGVPESDRALFEVPRDRWQTVIVGDISDFPSASIPREPAMPGCAFPTVIDDVYLCAGYATNDGPGGVLAFSFVEFVRSSTDAVSPGLPINGVMSFDIDDIESLKAAGNFDTVILHEMGKSKK
jgi:hypothetical protein